MINQYKVLKKLGKGSFATIKLCQDQKTKSRYAIKIMNKAMLKSRKASEGKTAYDCVLEELQVLQRLEHPNIIWLYEIINDEQKPDIYLVTEYHSRGSIGDMIKKKKRGLTLSTARLDFIDMLRALYYCHRVIKVIHRDIKPDNIMISCYNVAVLIDFGVSALVDQRDDDLLSDKLGSYLFFAPEMFQDKNAENVKIRGEKTDIWALGVTLFYMITG